MHQELNIAKAKKWLGEELEMGDFPVAGEIDYTEHIAAHRG